MHMDSRHKEEIHEEERGRHLAQLLGITYEELLQLHHSGLREVTDSGLHIYKYYIQFSRDSPATILDKLNMDQHNTVWFSAAEWHRPAPGEV